MAQEQTYHTPTATRARRRYLVPLVSLIAVLATGAVVQWLSAVLIPVVLALFVTLAVLPLDKGIAARLPYRLAPLGRVAVMLLLLLVLTAFLGGLTYCVGQIAAQLPTLQGGLDAVIPAPEATGPWATVVDTIRDMARGQAGSIMGRVVDIATTLAQTVAGAMGTALAGMVLVLFLILLALSEAETWEAKLDTIITRGTAPGTPGASWRDVTQTLGSALQRFIVTRAAVGVLSAAVYTAWLAPFGVELLMVWAILTFLMNFIPNIGALVSGVFPTLYAFATLDVTTALIIGVGLIVIEQVIGNWVDPRLQGNQIALSPLVILIAVVFWSFLWGAAGAFLGTPMTLAIMIICNALPALRPLALFLSNQSSHGDLDRALA